MQNISSEDAAKLRCYAELLSAANERARLTGPADPEVLYAQHICDALVALPFLEGIQNFVDVGTGGGLPGLVWGVCRPEIQGVLIDSIEKKTRLVAEMAQTLGCRNISVVHARSEEYAAACRETFDLATARAVAAAAELVEYLSPLVRVGGRIVAFKGPSVVTELADERIAWGILGLSRPTLHPYQNSDREGFLVVWEKMAPCPKRYPRNPGMAAKMPWYVRQTGPKRRV